MIPFQETFDKLEISSMQIQYTQPGDCMEEGDAYQVLKLETCDGGGGPFIRMSIGDNCGSSKYWSVDLDSIQELIDIFSDFKQRLNYEDCSNK